MSAREEQIVNLILHENRQKSLNSPSKPIQLLNVIQQQRGSEGKYDSVHEKIKSFEVEISQEFNQVKKKPILEDYIKKTKYKESNFSTLEGKNLLNSKDLEEDDIASRASIKQLQGIGQTF